MKPGEVIYGEGRITINPGRRTVVVPVANTSDQPVQVTSHYHFFEVNWRLSFDRASTFGMRLDIPAGSSVRFEPGETKDVTLVDYAGSRQVWGFNNLVDGALTVATMARALDRGRRRGFLGCGDRADHKR